MKIDLAIIPARAGSIGVPGKNIAELGGVPLIAWTVRAALASNCFRRVIVSTDGRDIIEAAKAAGAEVPFVRPRELATSHARSIDVIHHALSATQTTGSFALMQPTSPFRGAHHIQGSVEMFRGTADAAKALISVSRGAPAAWLFNQTTRGELRPLRVPEHAAIHRRQDGEPTFAPNGAIYLCQTESFHAHNSLFPQGLLSYPMGVIDSLDIDDPEDLALARAIVAADLRRIDQ